MGVYALFRLSDISLWDAGKVKGNLYVQDQGCEWEVIQTQNDIVW